MSGEKTQVLVSLDAEDVQWVKDHYPKKGTFTFLFGHALKAFIALHQVTPDELVKEGMRALNLEELQHVEDE